MGRDHAVLRRNRQDAAASHATADWAFGVVSDGCGEGAASEVGALLTVTLARAAIVRGLVGELELVDVAELALAEVERGLGTLVAAIAIDERETFVREHLLATLVGFVVRGRDAVLFAAGDGLWLANQTTRVLEQDNRPLYPAYALSGAQVPLALERVAVADRIAVATDGLDAVSLAELSHCPPRSLGRELVLRQRKGALADDGAIAIAVRGDPCAS